MTHCASCGSDQIKVDATMRGGSDKAGQLTYYRCQCGALTSRLTVGKATRPIAKPAHAPESAER